MFGKVLLAKNKSRWNSQLLMVCQLINLDDTQDINNVIEKRELALSTSDKVVLCEPVAVFDQFEEVTKLVQGEKYASLSLALHALLAYKIT